MLGRGGPQQLTFPEPIPCSHASGKPSSRSATLEPQKLTAKNETPPRTGEEFMRWHRGMCPIPARKSPAVARGLESRGSTLTSSLVPGWCGYSMASQDENPARAALSRLKAGSREPPWLELRYMRAPLRQHAGCARGSCDPPTVAVVPFRAGARFQKGRRRLRSPRLFWRKAHSRTPSPNDDSRRADCVAEDAVRCQPVSGAVGFPASRELAGNFSRITLGRAFLVYKAREESIAYEQIPCSREQGIF
jgi:hypothetical protein